MFRRFAVIWTIALALAGTADAAQRRAGRREPRQDRVVQRIQQRFNLNEAQKNGLRALQEGRQREMESLQQELQQKRQTLRQLMQQPNPNANDVGNATLSLRESRERQRAINQRFKSGVQGLLTPDQQQRLPKRQR